ncbi:hypothetical protein Tco_0496922 [Tanacetum coccineum]
MIHEPGDPDREVPVAETFLKQTNDELTEKEVKQMEADDQAIQIILMGLPEDIYAAVDSYETSQEICTEWIANPNANQIGTGNVVAARAEGNTNRNNDGSAEVHEYDNCYNNEIFNMFTQEEQYTELLEPIPEPHQAQQNNSNVISVASSMEQSRGIVEQHPATVEETRQSIQTMHMLSPKPESFYHTEQKMALGHQNPFYLKEAQQKQQSLYNGKVLLEKHDPPAVYDSEETLQLARESRLKMKQKNKEIKPANYAKINQISGVFVSQKAKSREELHFSNTSKTTTVSKSISIPNEEFSDDTFPNEIFPIVNQVDARLQNFKIQFLKEATKFVRDFKSLTKEADESLAKHKALEFEIERLLRAVVTRTVASSVGKKGKSKDTPCVSDTLDPLSQKLENENVELKFQVLNYAKENAHLKTTYKNLFDSINVTRAQTKTITDSLQQKLHDTIYENAKLRA